MSGVGVVTVLKTELKTAVERDMENPADVDALLDASFVVHEVESAGQAILPLIDGVPAGGVLPAVPLIDPHNGAAFASIAYAAPEDLDQAADSAARSSALWRSTSFEERAKRLRGLARLIYEQRDAIAQLISQEQGKPKQEALTQEILPALDHLKFIIRHAERYQAGLSVDPRHPFHVHKRAHYLYDAIGVVALVTPSPLPFAIPLIQVAAALAMGNAVVLKPSEKTPLSGMRVGELCLQAGFPPGLVNVVPTRPLDGLRLVAHPKVDKAFVTGGLEAGQSVMATAGCTPRPVVLSLGDHHPSVVAGDADVRRAARGIVWGALANCGQNCGAVHRVYVEESAATRFLECLLEEVDAVRYDPQAARESDLGPMLADASRHELHQKIAEALEGGAKLLRGGVMPEGPGFFYPPTVLLEPPADCRLMREETPGPLIPVVVVGSLERAIMLANDSDYALSASGWTRSAENAERLMVGLRSGVVTVNDLLYSFGEPAATWSGFRNSGIGQNHGTPGLREMSRQRFVSFDPCALEAPVFSYPYDDESAAVTQHALEYLHQPRRFARLKALWSLLRTPRFRSRVSVRKLLMGRRQSR